MQTPVKEIGDQVQVAGQEAESWKGTDLSKSITSSKALQEYSIYTAQIEDPIILSSSFYLHSLPDQRGELASKNHMQKGGLLCGGL